MSSRTNKPQHIGALTGQMPKKPTAQASAPLPKPDSAYMEMNGHELVSSIETCQDQEELKVMIDAFYARIKRSLSQTDGLSKVKAYMPKLPKHLQTGVYKLIINHTPAPREDLSPWQREQAAKGKPTKAAPKPKAKYKAKGAQLDKLFPPSPVDSIFKLKYKTKPSHSRAGDQCEEGFENVSFSRDRVSDRQLAQGFSLAMIRSLLSAHDHSEVFGHGGLLHPEKGFNGYVYNMNRHGNRCEPDGDLIYLEIYLNHVLGDDGLPLRIVKIHRNDYQ